ncbi:MAG: alpha-mannosidase [Candidatus Hydrogenedentes bacterium]|nr:alpha-mannosidase [Candidatus Hydrogenedentota bacterium]
MSHLEQERHVEMMQVRGRLREIQETIYSLCQPIGQLEACITGLGKGPEPMPASGWKPFALHGRWGGFDQTTWFRMTASIPKAMKGAEVVALIRPGGESLAYVNGAPRQGLDPNHDEVLLTHKARGGERFALALESVPSVRFDEYHYFERADLAVKNPLAWEFYWDCTAVFEVLEQLEADYAPRRQLLELLNSVVKSVDLQHRGEESYFDSIRKAQRRLQRGLKAFETSQGLGTLAIMGQSHIDTAWLWPLRETHRKCGRTFSTVLALLDRYPDFTFMCSQAVQYEWVKKDYPALYRRIKRLVKEGRWEPVGAMWVESDCNVPSGEALVRQLLYGNRFFRKEFGIHSRTVWLPDSFGYTWALPQILKKAQVDTFVTTKISWSRFTEFPYSLFQWEGADGSRVRGMMPPLNYNGSMTVRDAIAQWKAFKQKERVDEVPYPVGYGDGGGGPTAAMVERAKRLGNIVGIPKCRLSRFQDSVDRMAAQCDLSELPVWNGELYLELHRGCQTTQARTKRNNRKSESLLRDAELIASLALSHGARCNQKALEEAWKIVLTNQFHDILPGSSITEVYRDTDRDYARAQERAAGVRDAAAAYLAGRIDTAGPGTPVVVFNTLSWVRTDVVEAEVSLPKGSFHVLAPSGEPVPHQRLGKDRILFEAQSVPPLGYAVYRVVAGRNAAAAGALAANSSGMENDCLRITFDKAGRLARVYDKVEGRDVLAEGQRGNVLQLFEDRPAGNDAWDIDCNFEERMWEPAPADSIEVVESGPVRAVVRIVRRTERSTITQDVTLYAGSPRVDFVTTVDWQEKRVLMKAAFPVAVRSSRATYEIQFATIERTTHRNTAHDRAQFEVAGQRWADLSEGDYGVALLNDCKYGYDVKDNVLRLSLLRSPIEPDPTADEGEHHFTYALYPHAWDWRNGAVQQGAELNAPLIAMPAAASRGPLPAAGAFASVDVDHVVVDTVKKHEDSDALIVRCYEAYGQRGAVTLTFGRQPARVTECDLMEENDTAVTLAGSSVKFTVTPYEIRTFKVTF